jgi:ATP-dependent helicase/DNAse subunit B
MAKDFKYTKVKQDKYNAVWLSHSSVSDFIKCPRLYFLRNVWKNSNGRKVNTVSPQLALGSAVHACIEPLAKLKTEERVEKIKIENFQNEYDKVWSKFHGPMGGFENIEDEKNYKDRGLEMLKIITENPGPILNKTIKYYDGDFIPNIYLSEEENIILCGFVDWIEYIEKTNTLRVIDFKTGKNDEKEDSFQLPVYKILVESLQKRKVSSGAYWYLDRDKFPKDVELIDEDMQDIKSKILKVGLEIKEKKQGKNIEENFKCKYENCKYCKEVELIYKYDKESQLDVFNNKNKISNVEYLGVGEFKQDLYWVKK